MDDRSKSAEPKDPRIEAALRDYLERVDRGESVDREEFLARNALIADQLRSFIAAEEEVRKLAGADAPLDRTHDSTKSFAGHGQDTIAPQSVGKRAVEAEAGVSGLAGRFGRYRIIRALGMGAMGTVYLAEDTQLERSVALKTPHFTADPTGEQTERFFREARAAGNLRHPGICPIHDVGQIDGKHYISMAYIEGRPLSAFIQPDKPQTERQILIVIRKLALALQEAHDQGVVHRDLKPANIMVDKKGEPIIMDFGLAHQVRRNEDVRLTQTGNILGTPAFMSPEQVEGEPDKIGSSTDQYSLGVILYELLTSQLPFRGSVMGVMGQILTKEPPPPSQLRPDLDPRIEGVCLKMMAKKPSDRFASLCAVAEELATILKNPGVRPTSTGKSAGGFTLPTPAEKSATPGAGASQILKSQKKKTLTGSDLASLEESARKCYSRRDFEQAMQMIERIPEERRNAALQALLEQARGKSDEISLLICDIDEAVRLNDRQRALKKAEDLLKIKPGHHRAMKIQQEFAGYGEGGAARIGPLRRFTQPWHEGGWIPWSVLAFGLAVFGVMTAVVVIYLGKTAVMIDIKDPGVEVAVKGTTLTITGPDKQSVNVVPGDQELTISSAGLETKTQSFTIKRGETKAVTVSIINKEIVARLDNEIASLTSAGGKRPLPPPTPAHVENTIPAPTASTDAKKTAGYRLLFNGVDMSGWEGGTGAEESRWSVDSKNQILVGNAARKDQKKPWLFTERAFADFRLRLEFRMGPDTASGFTLRTIPWQRNPNGTRLMIQVANDPGNPLATGTIPRLCLDGDHVDTMPTVAAAFRPSEEWNLAMIEYRGRRLEMAINGQVVQDVRLEARPGVSWGPRGGMLRSNGRIGLLCQKGHVEFRKIEIEELSTR